MSTFVIRSVPLYKTRYNTRSVVGVGGDVRGGGDVVILCWPPPQPRRMIVPNNTLKTGRAISCLFERPEATPLTARRILRRAARVPSRTFLADIRPIIGCRRRSRCGNVETPRLVRVSKLRGTDKNSSVKRPP